MPTCSATHQTVQWRQLEGVAPAPVSHTQWGRMGAEGRGVAAPMARKTIKKVCTGTFF